MAALSYYTNWGAIEQLNSENMNVFAPVPKTEQLTPEQELLLGLMNDVDFAIPEAYSSIDNIFEPNEEEEDFFFFYSPENSNSLLPSYSISNGVNFSGGSPPPSDNYLCDDILLQQGLFEEPFHYPKRQKPSENIYEKNIFSSVHHEFKPTPYFNGLLPNNSSCLTLQDYYPPPLQPEIIAPLPLLDFPTAPPVYSSGSCDQSVKKLQSNGRSLSAQSIAARQRRMKITEKTQELRKLIPGGQKMNTAEMFQSAYKYIKFLQAQVGILESMGAAPASYHHKEKLAENGESFVSEEMQSLLESPLVQEKLYSTEKCLVPREFVQELSSSDHKVFKSKPQLLKDVRQLLPIKEN